MNNPTSQQWMLEKAEKQKRLDEREGQIGSLSRQIENRQKTLQQVVEQSQEASLRHSLENK